MITPAKWQTAEADQKIASDHSYGEFRKKLVPHMREVVFYPDCGNVFAISQVDGICYYTIDRQKHEKCIVKNKCIHQKYYNSVENRNITHQQTLVNVGNEIIEYLGKYSPYKIEQPNRYKRYQVWTNNQLTIGGQGGQVNYLLSVEGMHNAISISRILDSNDLVDMKCRTGASSCSFSSDSKEECEYFISWLNTRFNRFFIAINISKLTGVLTNHCFRFVPAPMVLDEHGNRIPGKFDHVYTDQELYKTWNLPQKYIDVIEAIVKERK